MPRYTLFFRGGVPANAEEGRARQPNWDKWFDSLGDKVADRGAIAKSLGFAGGVSELASAPPTSGHAVITAATHSEAVRIAETCPIYGEGGAVEVAVYVSPESVRSN